MSASRFRLSPWLGIWTAGVYLFLLAPLIVVAVAAFSAGTTLAFPPRSFSLRWFGVFFANRDFVAAFRISMLVACLAAALSISIAGLASYGLVRLRIRGRGGLQTVLAAPLYVPRVLIGVSLLLAFAVTGMVGSLAGLIWAHVLITMPYALRLMIIGFYGIDRSIEEAATTLGANRMQTFAHVLVPTMRSSILGALLFAFIVSFSDLYLAMFITGARTITLPLQIFAYLEWNSDPLPAAVSVIQMVLVFGTALLIDRAIGLGKSLRFG